jgi:hypothetical protein
MFNHRRTVDCAVNVLPTSRRQTRSNSAGKMPAARYTQVSFP